MASLDMGLFLMRGSARDIVGYTKLAEELGYEFVGLSDSQMLHYDTYVALTAAGLATSRIRLGPWVTNPITRHPTVTANAICTFDDLSDGRAFLGIGHGDSAVKAIGRRPARLKELSDAIELIRSLGEGRETEIEGRDWTLSTARGRMTIYYAANGPKQLQDAGRYGDGVIANGWLVPAQLEWMRDNVEAGARERGRRVEDLHLIFNTGVAIADTTEEAYAAIKPYIGRALCHPISRWVPEWTDEHSARLRAMYDYRDHMGSEHDIVAAVPDEMVAKKAVAGTPEECVELLQTAVDAGYRRISLFPFGDIPTVIRRLADEVLPKVRIP